MRVRFNFLSLKRHVDTHLKRTHTNPGRNDKSRSCSSLVTAEEWKANISVTSLLRSRADYWQKKLQYLRTQMWDLERTLNDTWTKAVLIVITVRMMPLPDFLTGHMGPSSRFTIRSLHHALLTFVTKEGKVSLHYICGVIVRIQYLLSDSSSRSPKSTLSLSQVEKHSTYCVQSDIGTIEVILQRLLGSRWFFHTPPCWWHHWHVFFFLQTLVLSRSIFLTIRQRRLTARPSMKQQT